MDILNASIVSVEPEQRDVAGDASDADAPEADNSAGSDADGDNDETTKPG
jgi:hypothetical protein